MHYRFTGELPLILGEFSHPDDRDTDDKREALVIRAVEPAEPDAPGATIVLHPGDELLSEIPIEHALLDLLDETGKGPKSSKSRGGTVPSAPPAAPTLDGTDETAPSDTDEILTPHAGADSVTGGTDETATAELDPEKREG